VEVPDIGMEQTIEPLEEQSQSKATHADRTSRTAALLNQMAREGLEIQDMDES
tara:strand:+ start:264 stop:422 length:159 start_codon:yes stop_codon:yes gene_type:complete